MKNLKTAFWQRSCSPVEQGKTEVKEVTSRETSQQHQEGNRKETLRERKVRDFKTEAVGHERRLTAQQQMTARTARCDWLVLGRCSWRILVFGLRDFSWTGSDRTLSSPLTSNVNMLKLTEQFQPKHIFKKLSLGTNFLKSVSFEHKCPSEGDFLL